MAVSKNKFANMYSENWAGIVSFTGSLILLLASDVPSLYAVALFFAAEAMLFRAGHRAGGYALACIMFALGDLLLMFSQATEGNMALKAALALQAAIWLVGVLRVPFEAVGRVQWSANLQHGVGLLNIVQRVPLILAAVAGGSWVMLVAAMFWAASDILAGRLQWLAAVSVRRWFGSNMLV
ncbi:MAG: hypothetical protein GC131_03005 [Alphaproteobacteria bacterium]|nr:hypothetical protein [Alphaproteobacteria bacterium]